MIEILYYLFIFPLQSVLEFIVAKFYALTHSYGASIVLLSLLVNLFLLKITRISEQKANAINALKSALECKVAEFRRAFKGAELNAYIRTLYKQRHYHPIYALSALGGLALQVPFFIATICMVNALDSLQGASFLWISDLSRPDFVPNFMVVENLHLLPILMTIFTLLNVFISAHERNSRIQGTLIALIFLVLLYQMPSALVLYWTCNMIFALIKTIYVKSFKQRTMNVAGGGHYPLNSKGKILNAILPTNLDSTECLTLRNITIFTTLNICFLICVFAPFMLYSSDVSQFNQVQTKFTLSALFAIFLCSSIICTYIFSFLYHTRFLKLLAYIVATILLLGVLYNFLIIIDYGAMNHFVLQNPHFLDKQWRIKHHIYFGIVLVVCLCVMWLFISKYANILLASTKILFITLFIISAINLFRIYDKTKDFIVPKVALDDNSNIKVPYEKELFTYSKNNKNIVIMVLDMFSGSHAPYILEQFPHFKDMLDGFVLFPNALSSANATYPSISALISGEHWTTYNTNARGESPTQSVDNAFHNIGESFRKNGYEVSFILHILESLKKSNPKYFIATEEHIFKPYFIAKNKDIQAVLESIEKYENSVAVETIRLLSFGLFKFIPDAHKKKIYNDGNWLLDEEMRHIENTTTSIQYTSVSYAYMHTIKTKDSKPTFKYLHSPMTHDPYGAYYNNGKCEFLGINTAWDDYPHNAEIGFESAHHKRVFKQHYDIESCAFNYIDDYIKGLKAAGIYDNTQIFIISDHSGSDSINMPNIKSRPDVLFLFKDFNSHGELKVDSRLMANYDIATIFCENLNGGCKNVGKNILKHYPKDREIIHTLVNSWDRDIKEQSPKWHINKAYKIKGDMHNEANWQDISDEIANIKQ